MCRDIISLAHGLKHYPMGLPTLNPEEPKKVCLARPQPLGRAERMREYVSTAKGQERRWPACRAYSAEVASATKAGSSGEGTLGFFRNTPYGYLEKHALSLLEGSASAFLASKTPWRFF
jgi:hypothetical protein